MKTVVEDTVRCPACEFRVPDRESMTMLRKHMREWHPYNEPHADEALMESYDLSENRRVAGRRQVWVFRAIIAVALTALALLAVYYFVPFVPMQ